MSRFGRSTSSCVLVFILAVTSFASTSSTATLTGRVIDPNGAVIVGAKVEATNIDTNVSSSTETNGEGLFVISNLLPGRYRVSLQKQGFQTIVKPEVELHVQDVISLNFSMPLGSITQSVTIQGGTSLAQTETAGVGTLVNRQFVENLPLNGRTFQALIGLAPGAVLASTAFDDGQFSVNGQRANANYFTVDGVSANIAVNPSFSPGQAVSGSTAGFSALGTTSNLVSIDALLEFRIQTSTYAPEFGRTPGAQVSIVTRSGTNEFHGSLFEYFRNDKLDANDWFTNSQGLNKPALRQNDFGAVLGGPLYLPSFGKGGPGFQSGKNRTFFFFSYEGLRLRLPQTRLTQVPSLNARQQAAAQAPQVLPFLKAYPLPNGRDLANNISEFSAAFSDPSNLDSTGIRIDHTISSMLTAFGRYSYAPSSSSLRGSNLTLATVSSQLFKTHTLTGGLTMLFAPNVSSDFRINYSRNSGESVISLDSFGGAVPLPDSLLFPSPFSSQNSQSGFTLTGLTNGKFSIGRFGEQVQRQINLVDTLSIQAGSHQLKLGVDYRRLFPIINLFGYQQNINTAGVNGALTGKATSATVSATVGRSILPVFINLSLFGQDTWRINQRISLTYGLRWEVNPAPREQNGHNPFALINVNDLPNLAFAPPGTSLYKTTYDNFAPRIGVAYQLSKGKGRETVLRGGFGTFYDLGNSQAAAQFGFGFPNAATKVLSAPLFPLDSAAAAPPVINIAPPFRTISGAIDPNLELPYTYQWNFAIQQSVGSDQTLTASYVAAIGRRLLRQERLVNPNPNFTTLLLTRNTATSDYHALQLEFQRRLAHGLQALAAYTWSKSLDNVSTDASGEIPLFKIDPRQERGPSSFDVRHAFNLALTYDIPKAGPGVAGALLRDWSVDSVFRTRSALPVNVVTGTDPFGILFFGGFLARPDLIPGVPLYVSDPTVPGGRRINKAAFDSATPFAAKRQGTLGRNALHGFSMWQLDFAVRRQFNLTERFKLQVRAEAFNIFNHPNFADPGMGTQFGGTNVLTNAQFGQSVSMLAKGELLPNGLGLNPLYQVGGPRSMQLALKFIF